jgi:hypothetical protein
MTGNEHDAGELFNGLFLWWQAILSKHQFQRNQKNLIKIKTAIGDIFEIKIRVKDLEE